jgi:hypothetical protein
MHTPGTASFASPQTIQPKKHHLAPKLDGDKGHSAVPAVNAGDDRLALRAKGLATVRREPVPNAKEENEALGVWKAGPKQCISYTPEQASRIRPKNVTKKAWPKYDPSLEDEMDSDDEYYAARIRTIGKAKEMYGRGSCLSPRSKSESRCEGSPMIFWTQSSPAMSLSSNGKEIKPGDRIADLAIALPPSASLHSSCAISTPSTPDEEIVFAGRDNITSTYKPSNNDMERSTSMGSSYSWRSTGAVVGPTREPDPDRRPPPPSAWAAREQAVSRGIKSKEPLVVNSGLVHKLVDRFTRLDVSGEEEFARRQTAKEVGHEADSEVHGKRKSKGFGF